MPRMVRSLTFSSLVLGGRLGSVDIVTGRHVYYT